MLSHTGSLNKSMKAYTVNTGYNDFQIPLGPIVVRRLSVYQENAQYEEALVLLMI